MNRNKIIDFLKKNKSFLQERFDVSRIGLFGSYATGTNTIDSDIDIIVSMPSDFDKFYDLKDFLETNLNHEVDLGLEKNMRVLIREQVEKEVIYV
ncbi:MAG TPA: nucleotidyltransferase domain-containing protein [Spirochaetota bacterium]|nr:nucleotidyltransferase domain-containing protein [Spirochaetota bacterium]